MHDGEGIVRYIWVRLACTCQGQNTLTYAYPFVYFGMNIITVMYMKDRGNENPEIVMCFPEITYM